VRNHGVVSIRARHHESGTPLAEIRVRGRLRFGHASSMDLREFTADDAASVRIATGIENVRNAVDAPWELPLSEHRMAMEVRHGWDGEPGRYFLAYDGDTAVGLGHIGASEWDNLDLAWLDLKVLPERRRSGHGAALLDGLLAEVRATERHLVGVDAWDGTPGPAFAEAHGFVHRSQEIKRRMHLAEVRLEQVRALRDHAAAAASSYELLRLPGRTPDDLLDGVVEMTRAINDAPTDDLEMEDEEYSPERIRTYENAVIQGDRRLYRLVARHRQSGELAGHTVVAVDVDAPEQSEQHDTSVVRAHRGHRLGLLLKAEMVLWLAEAEPQLETVDTWNAESNAHMIGVNERLGYRVLGREMQFQRRLS